MGSKKTRGCMAQGDMRNPLIYLGRTIMREKDDHNRLLWARANT